jgi:hypothetical protein
MSDNLFERIKDLSLSRLKEQTKISNLVFAGTQLDTHPVTGARIIKAGAYDACDPAGRLHTVVVNELGETVDLKTVKDADRRRLFGGEARPFVQYSYIVKFVCGAQEASSGCCPTGVRPGAYSTEINIFNYSDTVTASLTKRVYPVVHGGLPIGREPRTVGAKGWWDWLGLPPNNATMDDCCRIHHLLFDAEPLVKPSLTIGFLEIVSDLDLQVTAVYTATDLENRSISIDVESVAPKYKYPYYGPIFQGTPTNDPTLTRK